MPQSGMARSHGNSRFSCLNIAAFQRLCTEQRRPSSCSSVRRQRPRNAPKAAPAVAHLLPPREQKAHTQTHGGLRRRPASVLVSAPFSGQHAHAGRGSALSCIPRLPQLYALSSFGDHFVFYFAITVIVT